MKVELNLRGLGFGDASCVAVDRGTAASYINFLSRQNYLTVRVN